MNIKTTINVLLRVVFMTTMTFVMSIQTAGAQTKDPIDEAFMADVEKASLQNEDVRKGGRILGMAPKVAIPLFEKAINSSDPTVRRVAIISAAVTGVRHRVTFWEECYKTHFISCAAPVFYVSLHLDKILNISSLVRPL